MKCKWLSDDFSEICVNGDCPYCAGFCPMTEHPEVCKYFEESEEMINEPDNDYRQHCD